MAQALGRIDRMCTSSIVASRGPRLSSLTSATRDSAECLKVQLSPGSRQSGGLTNASFSDRSTDSAGRGFTRDSDIYPAWSTGLYSQKQLRVAELGENNGEPPGPQASAQRCGANLRHSKSSSRAIPAVAGSVWLPLKPNAARTSLPLAVNLGGSLLGVSSSQSPDLRADASTAQRSCKLQGAELSTAWQ